MDMNRELFEQVLTEGFLCAEHCFWYEGNRNEQKEQTFFPKMQLLVN